MKLPQTDATQNYTVDGKTIAKNVKQNVFRYPKIRQKVFSGKSFHFSNSPTREEYVSFSFVNIIEPLSKNLQICTKINASFKNMLVK